MQQWHVIQAEVKSVTCEILYDSASKGQEWSVEPKSLLDVSQPSYEEPSSADTAVGCGGGGSSFERLPSVFTWFQLFSRKTVLIAASKPSKQKGQRFMRELKKIISKQDKMLTEFEQALQKCSPGSSHQHKQLQVAKEALCYNRNNAVLSLSRARQQKRQAKQRHQWQIRKIVRTRHCSSRLLERLQTRS